MIDEATMPFESDDYPPLLPRLPSPVLPLDVSDSSSSSLAEIVDERLALPDRHADISARSRPPTSDLSFRPATLILPPGDDPIVETMMKMWK